MTREELAEEIRKLHKKRIDIWAMMHGGVSKIDAYNDISNKISELIKEMMSIPVTMEGFIDVEHEDNTEYYYLSCLNEPYDISRDVTEILRHNKGKYVRITIEEMSLDDRAKCNECEKRFKCLTDF